MVTRLDIYEELELAPIWRLKHASREEESATQSEQSVVIPQQPERNLPETASPVATFEGSPRPSVQTVSSSTLADSPTPGQVQSPSNPAEPVLPPANATINPDAVALRTAQIARFSFDALTDAIKNCTECGLCKGRKNAVPGMGDAQARWLIVGEAPGEEEDNQGLPFVGNSGKLLDALLARLGRERMRGIYIANVIKCRPPGNRNPEPAEVAACSPYLARQIELLNPTRIMAMGRFAAQTLLQTDASIGALRGKVHAYRGIPVHVTYHPSYLLRNLPEKARAWEDWLGLTLADAYRDS